MAKRDSDDEIVTTPDDDTRIILSRADALRVYGAALEAVAHGTEDYLDIPAALGEPWLDQRSRRTARINALSRTALPDGWGWRVVRAVRP